MIEQKIKYESKNCYFAGFLQNIINKSGVVGDVKQKRNEIVLRLNDSDIEALNRFSELTKKELPHSIFIGDIKTEVIDGSLKRVRNIKCEPCNISLCPKCLEEINDPASENYLNDSLVCMDYSNYEPFYDTDNTVFSPHYTKNSSILVCDIEKIDDMFILTDEEKKLLFSIEKPTIKATIKSIEIKKFTQRSFIDIKAPYNTRSTLVSITAKEANIPYLFFQDRDDLKITKVKDSFIIVKASRVTRKLERLNKNSTLNRFENIAKEANFRKVVCANLSTKGISFIVKNGNRISEVIKFKKFNLEKTLTDMEEDTIRKKLLNNFNKKFPNIYSKLKSGDYNLFETLSLILEVREIGFNGLNEKGLEFRGNGGLKIDLNYDEVNIDYSALIGSVISFKLAGSENSYIAYSIFEAFGDNAISTINQLKKQFNIKESIFIGDTV